MDRKHLKDNWPLPNEFLIELGRISGLWGVLESTVNLCINKLAGYQDVYDYRAAIMLAHANFKQRADILETLLEQTSYEHHVLKGYEGVMKLISRAQKGRNKYMHNIMGFDAETGKVGLSSMSARGKLKTNVEVVPLQQLKEVSAAIHEATCALHSLVTQNEMKPIWDRSS
ncbi:MAG: hypothetical protein HLX50_16625 [Alteromonadaceae bacterium]|nr:hypothetical protein [Alteromonadaceae bacterium]